MACYEKESVQFRRIGTEHGAFLYQCRADLTVKSAYQHIELFEKRPLFPLIQQPRDDERDEQYLDRHKCDVLQHIKEGVFGPVENGYLEKVGDHGHAD